MSTDLPLGKKEDVRTEFKGRAALDDPEIIAREVVALLNAEGGEVWVGIREEEGRAVTVEPVAEPEKAERRLRDSLVDSIDPPPRDRELEIQVHQAEERAVLRVVIRQDPARRPYAFLKKGGRHFVVRVGDRLRPMTSEEVATSFRNRRDDQAGADSETAVKDLREELEEVRARLRPSREEIFWLRLQPARAGALDFQQIIEAELLTDPTKTGNRRAGTNFTAAYTWGQQRPELRQDRLVVGREGIFWLSLRRCGGIGFEAPLSSWVDPAAWDREKKLLLWPLAILEEPTSVFRLVSKLYGSREFWEAAPTPEGAAVYAHMALFGLEGWSLRPGSPSSWSHSWQPKESLFRHADFILDRPLRFELDEVRDSPDRCAFRLVRRLYEAFGFREDAIPQEFDRKTERLVLPE